MRNQLTSSMDSPKIINYSGVTQRRSPRISEERWNSVRPIIEDLYMKRRLSLKDVMSIMENEHNFSASRRQYEYQFTAWDWTKYTSQKAMKAICRKAEEKPGRTFTIKGAPVSEKAIQRFRGRHADGPSARVSDPPTPSYLGWASPENSNTDDSQPTFADGDLQSLDDFPEQDMSIPDEILDSIFSNYDFEFISSDPYPPEEAEAVELETSEGSSWPKHQWQDPKYSLILQNLNVTNTARSLPQQWHAQMLVWSLWMCGDQSCLGSLASETNDRDYRLEGDLKRFEGSIDRWIRSSSGCPFETDSRDHSSSVSSVLGPNVVGQSSSEIQSIVPPRCRNGLQNWKTHAQFGNEMAFLKATGKEIEAKRLSIRLLSDINKTSNSSAFFLWFGRLLRLCQSFLINETSKLRNLPPNLRQLINEVFDGSSKSGPKETQAVGILAFLCYQRWTQETSGSGKQWEKDDWEKSILEDTGFTPMMAFQWVARLLLFHSQGPVKTLVPSAICGQALNGMSHIHFESYTPQPTLDNLGEQYLSPTTWVRWLAEDAAWFLPVVVPTEIPIDDSVSLWESSGVQDHPI